MRHQGHPKEGRQKAGTKQLADDGGGRWHGGQPGGPEADTEQVKGPLGFRGEQIQEDTNCSRRIHASEHVFASKTANQMAGVKATENVGQSNQGQRPTGH